MPTEIVNPQPAAEEEQVVPAEEERVGRAEEERVGRVEEQLAEPVEEEKPAESVPEELVPQE